MTKKKQQPTVTPLADALATNEETTLPPAIREKTDALVEAFFKSGAAERTMSRSFATVGKMMKNGNFNFKEAVKQVFAGAVQDLNTLQQQETGEHNKLTDGGQ